MKFRIAARIMLCVIVWGSVLIGNSSGIAATSYISPSVITFNEKTNPIEMGMAVKKELEVKNPFPNMEVIITINLSIQSSINYFLAPDPEIYYYNVSRLSPNAGNFRLQGGQSLNIPIIYSPAEEGDESYTGGLFAYLLTTDGYFLGKEYYSFNDLKAWGTEGKENSNWMLSADGVVLNDGDGFNLPTNGSKTVTFDLSRLPQNGETLYQITLFLLGKLKTQFDLELMESSSSGVNEPPYISKIYPVLTDEAQTAYIFAKGGTSVNVKVSRNLPGTSSDGYGYLMTEVANVTRTIGLTQTQENKHQTKLAINAASNGIWVYNGASWQDSKSSASYSNAEKIIAWKDKLVADFGSKGLYQYNGTAWTRLSENNPENIAVWGEKLLADFGDEGLWVYDGSKWSLAAKWNVESITAWDDKLAVDLGNQGLWVVSYSAGTYPSVGLTGWDAENVASWQGNLIADFGTNGLFKNNSDGEWTGLAGWDADSISVWGSKLVVDFGTNGLWQYNGSKWTGLVGWNPDGMAVWGNKLVVDFADKGLYQYDGTSWTGLTGWNPESLTAWEEDLAVDFGSNGIYLYDGKSWKGIVGWNPEQMEVVTYK